MRRLSFVTSNNEPGNSKGDSMQQQFRASSAQLNRHFKALLARARAPQYWGRGRKLLLACALALCLGAPAFAVVQGSFTDVPPSAFYYNAVEAIYRAGITSGCAMGLYCPDNAVTRGQMAVFMQRGLGRILYNRNNVAGILPPDRSYVALAQVVVDTTDSAPGQKVLVKLDGTLTAKTVPGYVGCNPCEIKYYISDGNFLDNGGNTISLYYGASSSGAATWALEVPTGQRRVFKLVAHIESTANASSTYVEARGALTAIAAPFGAITPPAP
jgi:hypothetical protein